MRRSIAPRIWLLAILIVVFVGLGGVLLAANDWSGDPDIVCAYRYESGALSTDSSGNGNSLTNVGVQATTTWYAEGSAAGLHLGDNDWYQYIAYASLPADLPGKANDQTWTVTGYFRRDSNKWVSICSMWDGGNDQRTLNISLWYDDGYKLTILIGHTNGTDSYTVTNTTVTDEDHMYFFAVVFDEGDVDTYLYNVTDATDHGWQSDTTTVVSAMSCDEGCDFSLGDYADSDSYGTLPMYGQLDEIIIWKRCLTQADVASVRAGTYTYSPPAGGGQVIRIMMSSIHWLIVPAFIAALIVGLKTRRKAN